MNSGWAGSKGSEPEIRRLCQNLAEASPIPTASINGETRLVSYANPAFCSLVRQRSDELVGNPFSAIAPDGEECSLLLDRVFQTGYPEIHAGSEHSVPHRFYWSYAIWPVLANAAGATEALIQVTETTAFHKQVTDMNEALLISSIRQHELAEAADALNVLLQAENKARAHAEDELRRANQDLHQLALAASHDLQEPLRMVIGFSELLRKGYQGHLTGARDRSQVGLDAQRPRLRAAFLGDE